MKVEIEYDPIRKFWYVSEASTWRNLWSGRHIATSDTREDALRRARIRIRDGSYIPRKEVIDLKSERPLDGGAAED